MTKRKKSWNPAEFLEKHKKSLQPKINTDPEIQHKMKDMLIAAQTALGASGSSDGITKEQVERAKIFGVALDKAKLHKNFKLIHYVRGKMDVINAELQDGNSPLVVGYKKNAEEWAEDGITLLKNGEIADAYFTSRNYGAALKDIVAQRGDLNKLSQKTRITLDQGKEAALSLENFFQAAMPEYKAYREHQRMEQTYTEALSGDADCVYIAHAVDTFIAPLSLYHRLQHNIEEGRSSQRLPPFMAFPININFHTR